MITRLVDDIRNAREHLASRPADLLRRTRHEAARLRGHGAERAWHIQTAALERAGGLLDRVESLPAVGRVARPVEGLVQDRLERVTAVPVPDYESLNARNAVRSLRQLGRVELLRVRRHELANKNRKTVLDAIAARIEALDAAPAAG